MEGTKTSLNNSFRLWTSSLHLLVAEMKTKEILHLRLYVPLNSHYTKHVPLTVNFFYFFQTKFLTPNGMWNLRNCPWVFVLVWLKKHGDWYIVFVDISLNTCPIISNENWRKLHWIKNFISRKFEKIELTILQW